MCQLSGCKPHPDDRVDDGAKCGRCGHELFDGDVINATGATLDKLLKDDLPVVVDFWAPWCAPCRMQLPIVKQMAEDGYRVGTVNVSEQMELAGRLGVMNIPTLVVFKDGKEYQRFVGLQSRETLESAVKQADEA